MDDVNGIDLYRLGRRLMKLGIEALPDSGFKTLPSSHRMVLIDVFENPGSSISEITARTGFPQSHVSTAVAKLRDDGVFVTATDPSDRRRTLVRRSPQSVSGARRVRAPIEPVLANALGKARVGEVAALIDELEQVAGRLDTSTAHNNSTRASATLARLGA